MYLGELIKEEVDHGIKSEIAKATIPAYNLAVEHTVDSCVLSPVRDIVRVLVDMTILEGVLNANR